MAYKALKELIQNSSVGKSSAPPLSSQLAPLGDIEVERKPLKTSLRDKIAFLEKGLTAEPKSSTCSNGFITQKPVKLQPDIESSDERGKDCNGCKLSSLQPCSSRGRVKDSEAAGHREGVGVLEHGKRKLEASEEVLNAKTPASEAGLEPVASGSLRMVKPRGANSIFSSGHDSTAGEKAVVDSDLIEEPVEETQSLIHALEDYDLEFETEAGVSSTLHPQGSFEPLVLWSAPGEGSSTGVDRGETVEVPASINSRLLDHQREGIRFLYKLYRNNHGGILGDDMGLGKTIQSIGFLAAIFGKKDIEFSGVLNSKISSKVVRQKGPCGKVVLIICPTSVLQNWDQEIEAWGEFQVGTFFGLQREVVLGRIESEEVEIVLTSHDTFRIHGEELCRINWDCVIVDEAHRLKNEKSHLYIMCMKLPTKRRYGLTGTVMQNTYLELFNVFEWATPGCLGSREHFKEYYSGPIKEGQRITAPQRFVAIAEDRQRQLLVVLRKYFLRRTKQETIAHLMKGKEDNVIFCSMTSVQKRVYRRLLQSPDYQALIGKALPCTCGSPLKRGECCYRIVPNGVIWSYLHKDSLDEGCDYCPNCLTLPCLTKLQQVSNHLELIKPNSKEDETKQENEYNFAKMALGEDADLVGGVHQETSFIGLSDAQHCGKMLALEKLLSSWIIEGDKVLLFSYSVKMLDILDKFLIRKGYCFNRLDGSTPMSLRQSLVEDFNTSPSKQIFLISTRAGGLGLNLVSANRVLIFDPNWNPSHDLQAQDRSFRYGQVRHVTVYRLLAAGSLEELIYTRQIYKQQLFNIGVGGASEKRYFEGVQGSKEHKGELFGIDNLLKDISEEIFAERIIENHEDRLTRLQQDTAFQENHKQGSVYANTEGLDDIEGSQGLLTCVDIVDPDNRQPTPRYKEDNHSEENRKERLLLHTVQNTLTMAGVVYAHRNEDIVNMAPFRLEAPGRNSSGTKSCMESNVQTKKQREPVQSQHLQEADNRKTRKPKVRRSSGTVEVKAAARSSACLKGQSVGKGSKKVFVELAKFKGLNMSDFSKWFLSATQAERGQLRLEYQKSLERPC